MLWVTRRQIAYALAVHNMHVLLSKQNVQEGVMHAKAIERAAAMQARRI